MTAMLGETGIRNDQVQIVTLGAQVVRAFTTRTEDWIRKKVLNGGSRSATRPRRYLAELIAPFQDVRELRAMRAVRTCPSKFPVVIAVVTIGAKDSYSHGPSLRGSIQIEHKATQAELGQIAIPIVQHRMA